MRVGSELERALRTRGFNDGYAGYEKAFPKEQVYLDSYANGRLARQRGREGGQEGRAARAEGSGSRPPAHNRTPK